MILEHNYLSYDVACTLLNMEPLYIRRTQLCINFAKKDLKKKQTLFTRAYNNHHTRSTSKLVQEHKCRTKRYQKSSIPYLSKLLNNQS